MDECGGQAPNATCIRPRPRPQCSHDGPGSSSCSYPLVVIMTLSSDPMNYTAIAYYTRLPSRRTIWRRCPTHSTTRHRHRRLKPSSRSVRHTAAASRVRMTQYAYIPSLYSICTLIRVQLKEPFCQPFGNRQLMHCTSSSPLTPSSPNAPSPDTPIELDKAGNPVTGLVPAWASCGRIPARERADFWEFVGCNAFIAACALGAVIVRGRKISALATRELAARIGVGVRAV